MARCPRGSCQEAFLEEVERHHTAHPIPPADSRSKMMTQSGAVLFPFELPKLRSSSAQAGSESLRWMQPRDSDPTGRHDRPLYLINFTTGIRHYASYLLTSSPTFVLFALADVGRGGNIYGDSWPNLTSFLILSMNQRWRG